MDNEKAKLLLSGYRPNGKDAEDPEMRRALDLLEHDADLRQWFSREQEFDALISEKLRDFPVPEEGKTSVRAGRHLLRTPTRWGQRSLLAAAAIVIALLALAVFPWGQPDSAQPTLVDFRQEVVDTVRGDFRAEFYSSDPVEIDRWLMENGLPVAGQSIAERIRNDQFGCAKMVWNGRPVSVVCLQRGKGEIAHLFIARLPEGDAKASPVRDEIILATVSDLNTASWQDGDKAYVLIGHAPSVRVAPFL